MTMSAPNQCCLKLCQFASPMLIITPSKWKKCAQKTNRPTLGHDPLNSFAGPSNISISFNSIWHAWEANGDNLSQERSRRVIGAVDHIETISNHSSSLIINAWNSLTFRRSSPQRCSANTTLSDDVYFIHRAVFVNHFIITIHDLRTFKMLLLLRPSSVFTIFSTRRNFNAKKPQLGGKKESFVLFIFVLADFRRRSATDKGPIQMTYGDDDEMS